MRTVFPYTGLRHHRVFADALFEGYDYQLNLVYENAGTRTVLPFHTIRGFESYSISDRAWSLWWKRTQGPTVTTQQAERNLLRWVQFFSVMDRYDMGQGSVAIEARPQTVELAAWKAGLLDDNLAQSWTRVGSISLREGELELEWNLAAHGRSQNPEERLAGTVHATLQYVGRQGLVDTAP